MLDTSLAKSRVYVFFVGLFTLNISNLILESLVKFVMVRIIKTPYSVFGFPNMVINS